ncbi:hypothetical protein BDZ45DRAFT_805329 [Acephala macrosclerotiorum]|nr:hypothetical protein BDZ45DRAFT_805329 [Acephala macrosclerotiorum]
MSRTLLQVLIFWAIQQGNAIPTQIIARHNTTEDSTQQYEPRWVAGPRTRGTLGLVFSCVITLFLCVWTTVHVNIEPDNEVNPTLVRMIRIRRLRESKTLLKLLAKRVVRKLGWSFVTLLVPEGVMAIAAYERRTAHLLLDAINEIISNRNSRVPDQPGIEKWDMNLAYYAVMGGFVIPAADYDAVKDYFKGTGDGEKETGTTLETDLGRIGDFQPTAKSGTSSDPISKEDTAVKVIRNGEEEKQPDVIDDLADVPKNRPLTLTPYAVLQLAKWQWNPLPTSSSPPAAASDQINLFPITSAQVQDKSNANSLAKALVAWQALWMIVQVIARRAETPPLPVTLLELHTCLHTFCAFAMYLTWWSKPVDIDQPTTVHLSRDQIIFLRNGERNPDDPTNPWNPTTLAHKKNVIELPPPNRKEIASVFLTSRSGLGKLMYHRLCGHRNLPRGYFDAICDAYIRLWKGRRQVWKEGLRVSFVGLVFGGVHLAAWNSVFPSFAEMILWKISATITATAWLCFVLSLWLSVFVERKREESRMFSKLCGIFLGVGIFPVLLVRVYLLVESFASIRKLPLGSYSLDVWSNIWPHAG